MRVLASCILAVLIAASSVLVMPSRADAYSHLIYFLADKGCAGQSSYIKNGCYAYLEPRVLQCKSPEAALSQCNSQCDSWFSPSAQGQAKCKQGCQFVKSQE